MKCFFLSTVSRYTQIVKSIKYGSQSHHREDIIEDAILIKVRTPSICDIDNIDHDLMCHFPGIKALQLNVKLFAIENSKSSQAK